MISLLNTSFFLFSFPSNEDAFPSACTNSASLSPKLVVIIIFKVILSNLTSSFFSLHLLTYFFTQSILLKVYPFFI